MSAPLTVRDVMRGPHIVRTTHSRFTIVQEVEPLRFIPRSEIGKCVKCGCDRYDSTCGLSRCPQREARHAR